MRTNRFARSLALAFVVTSLAAPNLAHAEVSLLLNDSFVENGSVGFQQGFATNEAAGVTLGPVSGTFTVRKVQFLFGPVDSTMRTVTVQVYEEDTPGVLGATLHEADYQIAPSSDALHVIDLTAMNIVHDGPGSLRVAVQVSHSGAPGVARDDDGCTEDRNWIFTNNAWIDACEAGVMGDWVIRAEIDGPPLGEGGAGGGGGASPTTSSTTVTSSASSGGAGGGASGGEGGEGDPSAEGGCNCSTEDGSRREGHAALFVAAVIALARRRRALRAR